MFMAHDRTAIDTIRGYYYQFDFFINQVFRSSDDDVILLEGIEDIDIHTATDKTAVQCKYYEGTEFNFSVIAEPIRWMLSYFLTHQDIKYHLYAHYKSGTEKLSLPLTLDVLKKKFLTYSREKVKHEFHVENGISDDVLQAFISALTIQIDAPSFDEQEKDVRNHIQDSLKCGAKEVDYYYSRCLHIVRVIASNKDEEKRKLSKKDLIRRLTEGKDELYDEWQLKVLSAEKYCAVVKKRHFSSYNPSPYDRFFLIEASGEREVDIYSVIQHIQANWSNISRRQKNTFCPYVYINGIDEGLKKRVMNLLYTNGIHFKDGFDYKDADFDLVSILTKPDAHNGITLKFVHELEQVEQIIKRLRTTREVYQFFKSTPFYENSECKHIKIAVEKIEMIENIV